jgi:uncharacterized protein YndB with AHSA1/START domain
MGEAADREIRAETVVAATPAEVWRVLGDVRRMPELSPELVRMLPLKPGGLRPGQWYLGINRRGLVVWPTRSVLTDVEPGRLLAWDTATSGARWVWELAPHAGGTRVVHRRPVPRRLTMLTRLFATLFLRGPSRHTDDLEQDMARSVANLQRAVETGS